ncbi:MAG: HlyD family efflux transporter periplasmic adaptor subunit [Anaerolineales bacterium]
MKRKLVLPILLTLILAACAGGASTPTPLPTVLLGSGTVSTPTSSTAGASVTASGIVVADQQASLAFSVAGNVKLVNAVAGDQVQAGQMLVQLDDTTQQIELEQANMALDELTSPEAIASAQLAVTTAQTNLTNAQTALNNEQYWQNSGLSQNEYANVILTKNNLDKAQATYDRLNTGGYISNVNEATAYQALYAAQQAYNTAEYYYSLYSQAPTQNQLNQAQANLALANATLTNAQTYLKVLTGGEVPANASGTALLQLEQARLAVQTAQADLNATRLVAPFSGEVASVTVSIGDYVIPGQVVVVISDVSHMHIETTDLSERDVPKVKLGQTVTVFVKALNQDVTGKVSAISPLADTLGGDVVYKVTILLEELPSGVRAGMSVDVTFDTGQ